MSQETVQWIEIAREAYVNRNQGKREYRMDCHCCGQVTDHIYLNDQGIYERYQCRVCGMIRSVAVR